MQGSLFYCTHELMIAFVCLCTLHALRKHSCIIGPSNSLTIRRNVRALAELISGLGKPTNNGVPLHGSCDLSKFCVTPMFLHASFENLNSRRCVEGLAPFSCQPWLRRRKADFIRKNLKIQKPQETQWTRT